MLFESLVSSLKNSSALMPGAEVVRASMSAQVWSSLVFRDAHAAILMLSFPFLSVLAETRRPCQSSVSSIVNNFQMSTFIWRWLNKLHKLLRKSLVRVLTRDWPRINIVMIDIFENFNQAEDFK